MAYSSGGRDLLLLVKSLNGSFDSAKVGLAAPSANHPCLPYPIHCLDYDLVHSDFQTILESDASLADSLILNLLVIAQDCNHGYREVRNGEGRLDPEIFDEAFS